MKKLLSVMAMVLLASPCFAQEDFGGGFGGGFDGLLTGSDIDALLGGGRGNRGNNNGTSIPNPEQLLLQMKDLLKAKKVPLTKDQEKALKTFLDTETVAMRTELETQYYGRGHNNNNRGNTNNTTTVLTEIFTTVTHHNTQLLTAIKADLTPDQASLITKAEKDKKVCTVLLDLFNPQQLQNRNEGNRGGRGNNNNNQGFNNFPAGLDGLGFEFQGGGGFPQGGNRGNNNQNNNNFQQAIPDRAFCTTTNSTTAERVAPISQILTKGKKPLTPDQETKVASLIEARVPVMQQEMRDKNPEMARLANSINNNNNQNRNNNNQNNNNTPPAVNPQTLRNNIVSTIMTQLGIPNTNNNNNNNNNNRGRGGNANFQNQNNQNQNQNQNNQNPNNQNANANQNQNANANANANNNNANANNNNRGNRGNNNFNIEAEVRRKNEELYDKMPVAAKLDPPQAAEIKKYKYAQIKARGGVERYRGIMEEEGTPLTPEQTTQIQSLMNASNQAVRQYADNLVGQEMAAVPSLEPPPTATPTNQNQNNQNYQNRNPNNVAQNPVAQQIVAKVMPEVSKRHAGQDRALTETIMRVLTPQQVASYKLSTMN
jgi:hypothetical protein